MKQLVLAAAFSACVVLPAFAQSETGGPSGGPNQSQAVVPAGATGGKSGGPNQSQSVVKKKSKQKMHH